MIARDLASAFQSRLPNSTLVPSPSSSSTHTTTPTMPSFHMNTITLAAFKDVLSRYPAMVPEKLRDLDVQRYDTIRKVVAAQEESEKHLTKDQVVKLVEWKLYVTPFEFVIACKVS
jgi:hypothetical protein